MKLPIFQDPNQNMMLLETSWASAINPIISLPILQGNQINGVVLVANTPLAINHLLQRQQQGWIITDQNAAANIYRTQAFNSTTLTLESSANVTINIWCF